MIKIGLCAIMMILSLLIGFQEAIIIVHFKLNQEAIEREFCINKSKPELHCHGICHLKKQLQDTEKPNQNPIAGYRKIDMIPVVGIEFNESNLLIEDREVKPIYLEISYLEPSREIFIPPPIVQLQ